MQENNPHYFGIAFTNFSVCSRCEYYVDNCSVKKVMISLLMFLFYDQIMRIYLHLFIEIVKVVFFPISLFLFLPESDAISGMLHIFHAESFSQFHECPQMPFSDEALYWYYNYTAILWSNWCYYSIFISKNRYSALRV